MKRLQVIIEEGLDAARERVAVPEGISKAVLIRRFVREPFGPLPPLEADPFWRLAGGGEFEPEPVDDVTYRKGSRSYLVSQNWLKHHRITILLLRNHGSSTTLGGDRGNENRH